MVSHKFSMQLLGTELIQIIDDTVSAARNLLHLKTNIPELVDTSHTNHTNSMIHFGNLVQNKDQTIYSLQAGNLLGASRRSIGYYSNALMGLLIILFMFSVFL